MIKYLILFTVWMFQLFLQVEKPDTPDIYLIGDSTMSQKILSKYPETGWGMAFPQFLQEGVAVKNFAKNGRSTRTFIEEGLWTEVLSQLNQGDILFIQFGHNDQSETKPDRYTPPLAYQQNLKRFVVECREKGAFPILLTPVSRRKFDSNGKQLETHGKYPELVSKVAVSLGVPLIDLNALSINLYQNMGEEASKLLFLHLDKGEHPNYPDGLIDNTHFSEYGARMIAQLVWKELKHTSLEAIFPLLKP